MARGEERPVIGGVALEEGDFGQYEEYWSLLSAASFEMKFRIERLTADTACD